MARKKNHETPDNKRITITLNKAELKILRHLGIDIEMSDEEVIHFAVERLMQIYQAIPVVNSKNDLINPDIAKFHDIIKEMYK